MPHNYHDPQPIRLSLPPREWWTLHHVLLDRIEAEATASNPTAVQPPPIAVYQAFETLDAGDSSFTVAELEAMQQILAAYHHGSPAWEAERAQIEQILHRVTDSLESRYASLATE